MIPRCLRCRAFRRLLLASALDQQVRNASKVSACHRHCHWHSRSDRPICPGYRIRRQSMKRHSQRCNEHWLTCPQFDNSPGVAPAASPIGNTATGALVYNTWEYYTVQALSPALQAQSPPNVATYGSVGETANGQPVWKPRNSSILYFAQER